MELRHFRYFVAVAQYGGFREAARRLHVTQPALTQTIQDLEYEIGTLLVDRGTRPASLTRAGTHFLQSAQKLLAAAEAAVADARRVGRGLSGVLRIAFIPFATHHFLPDLLREFKQRYPSIELEVRELTPAAQWKAFTEGTIDIGFTREPTVSQHSRLSSLPLFDVPLVAIVRRDYPVKGPSIQMADLADSELVLLPRKESPVLYDSILKLCAEAGFSPVVNSFPHLAESMVTLVEAGQGVAILPIWARVFADVRLRCVLLAPDNVRAELVAAWCTDHQSSPVHYFLALLRENMERVQRLTDAMMKL